MISFLICLALLVIGYLTYGKVVDNTFGPDDRETPAIRINDGVDYVVMPQWKLFLVQLLNIAGLGPIFGAMQGALWGPVVFLWITFGTIFAGGVHDYFSGMLSERNDGASISEVCGIYLGNGMKNVMRVFSVVLLVMVGTVFAVGPAGLIVTLFQNGGFSGIVTNTEFWLWIVLAYYFIATFLSIDKIIGKISPVFGICLIIMAVGVGFGIMTNPAYEIPELWTHFYNMEPTGKPIWSFMFITVACGAVSGFHSLVSSGTSSKTVENEKDMLKVGYGAMVLESLLAVLALCVAGAAAAADGTPAAGTPFQIFSSGVAGFFEMFGVPVYVAQCFMTMCVSALALTSLDAVARIGRMSFQELFSVDDMAHAEGWRKLLCNTYFATIITLAGGFVLTQVGYSNIWPLFGSANQLLSALVLVTLCVFLKVTGRSNKMLFPPLVIMLCVTFTALVQRLIALIRAFQAGSATFMLEGLQLIIAVLLIALGLTIVVNSLRSYFKARHNSEVE